MGHDMIHDTLKEAAKARRDVKRKIRRELLEYATLQELLRNDVGELRTNQHGAIQLAMTGHAEALAHAMWEYEELTGLPLV